MPNLMWFAQNVGGTQLSSHSSMQLILVHIPNHLTLKFKFTGYIFTNMILFKRKITKHWDIELEYEK